jgi:hypothetical protein
MTPTGGRKMPIQALRTYSYERGEDNYLLMFSRSPTTRMYHLYWLKNGHVEARANLGIDEESALITYRQTVRDLQRDDS